MNPYPLVDHVRTKAHLTDEVTELERSNFLLSRLAAEEAIVLLENDRGLPLKRGCKVALLGSGATHTVKGGSGSGEVNERRSISIYQGMKDQGFVLTTTRLLRSYAETADRHRHAFEQQKKKQAGLINRRVTMSAMNGGYTHPPFPRLKAETLGQDAEVCVYVISRVSGEAYDRKLEQGDYYLTETEISNLRLCVKSYKKVILAINAGGPVDLSSVEDLPFGAVLFLSMLGSAGGEAVARTLLGEVSPSGCLTATWPARYEDLPFCMEYSYLNGKTDKEDYKEGIFVGYRYFDTFDIAPRYCFGHGLSYTDFHIRSRVTLSADTVTVAAQVTNKGSVSGKCVVQTYVSCPNGRLMKEYQRLTAFGKTGLLGPGQTEQLRMTFPLSSLSSYEEEAARFLLEKGRYVIRVGRSSRCTEAVAALVLQEDVVVSQHCNICPLEKDWKELHPGEPVIREAAEIPEILIDPTAVQSVIHVYREPSVHCDAETKALMRKLSAREMLDLTVGAGTAFLIPGAHYYTVPGAVGYTTCKYAKKGITDLSFCDGPAGVRLPQKMVALKGRNITKFITAAMDTFNFLPTFVKRVAFGKPSDGTLLYQYTTAFPVGTALAQTWNVELVRKVGEGVNRELEEYGVHYWLAPGMNIHRNPLCGRNYEYFSEDPVLSGKIAAAEIRGVQRRGTHFATVKHYLCNNQETNRLQMNAQVTERTMREIYLRGFEIAVREGKPGALMTGYNRINGVFNASCHDTLTKVLRCEWGFEGLVMTDWDACKPGCSADASLKAGMDLMMPGDPRHKWQLHRALQSGLLPEACVRRSAARILSVIAMHQKEVWKGERK